MHPQRLTGPRVDRRGAIQRGAQVEDAVDHQRRCDQRPDRRAYARLRDAVPRRPQVGLLRLQHIEQRVGRDQRIAGARRVHQVRIDRLPVPHELEVVKVVARDLVERGVLCAPAVAGIASPLPVLSAILRLGRDHDEHRRQHERGYAKG